MNDAVKSMLESYRCRAAQDYINAMKEIIQNIALLGLWRAKFFEQAAFYGGSALRILYGLNRFSEDLDFSLLKSNVNFQLKKYNEAVKTELNGFGFEVELNDKIKSFDSNIQSAFIKTNTYKQLLIIQTPRTLISHIHKHHQLKIKMEVDTDPPLHFKTEAKILLQPIPFSVNTFQQPDLFAGKIHALLCRNWKNRVKGRDWFDLSWYVGKKIPVRLSHLKARLIQSGLWEEKKPLELNHVIEMLKSKIGKTDFQQAKHDVFPFVKDSASVALWSNRFFEEVVSKITAL